MAGGAKSGTCPARCCGRLASWPGPSPRRSARMNRAALAVDTGAVAMDTDETEAVTAALELLDRPMLQVGDVLRRPLPELR